MELAEWLGPQSATDPTPRRRHRFHQSWYRAFILGAPAGTGPKRDDTSRYGNMLTAEDGQAGHNFLTDEIHQIAEARIAEGGTVEPFRCRHNMLSSQPMCFNLFGHLKTRPHLAATFVAAVTGREAKIEDGGIRIEDSPGHLDDVTGLDASIRYRTADDRTGVLGVETKLTDQFSPKVYELDSKPAYREYSEAPRAPFRSDRLEALTDSRWNQLWRNQLLCEAIKHHESRDFAEQIVVFPGGIDDTMSLIAEYATLLSRPDAVQPWTLTDVLATLEPVAGPSDRPWLDSFRTRYINLQLSDRLFAAWQSDGAPFNR